MAEDKPETAAPAEPKPRKVQPLRYGVNAFCRPGDLVGPHVTRASELDEEHCVEAGAQVLEAATKGGVKLAEMDRPAAGHLRQLNILGALGLKLSDKAMQAEFAKQCQELAGKQAPFQKQARIAADAEKAAAKAVADHNARKAAARA